MADHRLDISPITQRRSTACVRQAPIIAIDGPAGTGKSTLALRLAQYFRWQYIDSGAMYRVVALCALEQRVDWADEPALVLLSTPLTFEFLICAGHLTISVGGRNVTQAIRSQAVAEGAARVATIPPVRAILVDKQRQLGCAGGVVMDGRDIGTLVFPDAEVKFYLDATLEARAQRRWLELEERGELMTLSEVREAIGRRDQEDRTRDVSPLRVAEGAYAIDTTNLSVDEVFQLMVDKVKFSASLSTLLSPTRE